MKKIISGICIGVILGMGILTTAQSFIAEITTFPIFVKGNKFVSDKPAVVINGSTYLPLKALGDVLNQKVIWNSEKSQVEIGSQAQKEGTLLFEDSTVKISFLNANSSNAEFLVKNKTDKVLTIQADSLAINGMEVKNILMSDNISPMSKGTVSMSCKADFEGDAKAISGQLIIIDFEDMNSTIKAKFTNIEINHSK